jgi:hypothetical protein
MPDPRPYANDNHSHHRQTAYPYNLVGCKAFFETLVVCILKEDPLIFLKNIEKK